MRTTGQDNEHAWALARSRRRGSLGGDTRALTPALPIKGLSFRKRNHLHECIVTVRSSGPAREAIQFCVCQNAIVLALSIAGHCVFLVQASADHPAADAATVAQHSRRDCLERREQRRRRRRAGVADAEGPLSGAKAENIFGN